MIPSKSVELHARHISKVVEMNGIYAINIAFFSVQ
jgi:hypothetical protein